MITYNPEVLTILEPRVHKQELHGYYGGKISPDKTKFFAYTYVLLKSIDFDLYSYVLTSTGCSSTGIDFEKMKKHLDQHSYQMKSTEECIQQGIYTAYSMKFFGAYYDNEWFVLNELIYFGEQMSEEAAKALLSQYDDHPDRWNLSPFEKKWSLTIPGTNRPMRDIEREEFTGLPWLVSHVKIERKNQVNHAFRQYMNASIVHSFLRRMRIEFYDEYSEFVSLYGEDYTLIFPESKIFFLVITMAKHKTKGYRLVWFFYDTVVAKFYRWTFPQPRYTEWSYHYSEDVIMDLKAISDWDDYLFLTSSRTMDDQHFWAEYVLKKEGDRYLWLDEID